MGTHLRPRANWRDAANEQSKQALIGGLKVKEREIISKTPESDLRKLTHQFAQRAFRRPVTADEVKPYSDFAIKRFRADKSFEVGLRAGYRAILCSPRFLYFEEPPGKLDDYALASRLSHFLWGKGPDDQLLKLAAEGTIGQSTVLTKQVERMRQHALHHDALFGQWPTCAFERGRSGLPLAQPSWP